MNQGIYIVGSNPTVPASVKIDFHVVSLCAKLEVRLTSNGMTSFFEINKTALISAVAKSASYSEVLRRLGRSTTGNNRPALKRAIDKFELSVSHFNAFKASADAKKCKWATTAKPLAEVLKENVHHNTSDLRRKLLKAGLLKNICSICGLLPIWNDKPLTLQLDHINGVRLDNRIGNLRILCPNCHAQTDTFAGKLGRPVDVLPTEKAKTIRPKKIAWPEPDILCLKVWNTPVNRLAKELGVSGAAIKKHCKSLGISTPPRGYWQKQASVTS